MNYNLLIKALKTLQVYEPRKDFSYGIEEDFNKLLESVKDMIVNGRDLLDESINDYMHMVNLIEKLKQH